MQYSATYTKCLFLLLIFRSACTIINSPIAHPHPHRTWTVHTGWSRMGRRRSIHINESGFIITMVGAEEWNMVRVALRTTANCPINVQTVALYLQNVNRKYLVFTSIGGVLGTMVYLNCDKKVKFSPIQPMLYLRIRKLILFFLQTRLTPSDHRSKWVTSK